MIKSTSSTNNPTLNKYSLDTLHQMLNNELGKYKHIKVPNIDHSISGPELASWLIDSLPPKEIEKLIYIVNQAKKRSSDTKPIFQTAAAALIK
ncbi:hypothetical protein DFO70_108308 [Cytobacillus firmus]|uniref:Uncharacterized protein n=2 Tax=Cytobacillus TaxID=2675230 RepID=A0A366JSE2_CYTFI|nr:MULTISPECIES: hypothetical protein [Cytobacillus]RBP91516.1 hypothetical protein DFO70_108308 [Cytobacillus firmus]TDX41716.1 hypothetical protein DFO72_108308 [Cytobacillus oceanisediminis]